MKCFALTSVSASAIACKESRKAPDLRGLSPEHYWNFKSIQEVFLQDNPVPEFDLGLALDQYMYGHPSPIETESVILLLAGIPSSVLAAIALDFSFVPLSSLSIADREERLKSWKYSKWQIKRGAYTILRQTSFFLLSSNKEYQRFVGYLK